MRNFKTFLPPFVFIIGVLLLCLGMPLGVTLIVAALILCRGWQFQHALYAFPSNCEGRIITVESSAGCTLTRASIIGMTPNDFETQGFKEIGMDRVYAQAREARMAGYVENTLTMLLNGRISNIKGALTKTAIGRTESVILPFFSRRQKRNINSNYWKIASGTPTPGAGANGLHPGDWDVVVQNNPSQYATVLQDLHRYFLPGKAMFIEYASSGGTAYSLQYKIIAAYTSGSVTTVTLEPNYTGDYWTGTLSAPQRLPYQIGGVAGGAAEAGTIGFLGVNNVADWESWNGQDPAENPNSLLNYWWQTSRIVHEYTDEYVKALTASLTSHYFKEFRQLPLAQQKAIQQKKFDRDLLNSAFYGQRINENQNVETYRSLPQVKDVNQPDCTLEYKAGALGFRTQLNDCGRVLDHQGNPLNLDNLLPTLYNVKRSREVTGGEVQVIDVLTDRFTAGQVRDIFTSFYLKKTGVVTNRNYRPDQALTFQNQVLMNYDIYQIPPELGGYELAVFWHSYFDDKLAAAGNANVQRRIWLLDWTDIEFGVGATNSVVRKTNEADKLYEYVMKVNIKHVTMNSITWAPVIEDPMRHYIVENFSNACPVLTVAGCEVAPGAET